MLTLFTAPVLLLVGAALVIVVGKVANKKEAPNTLGSSVGTVLAWLGGAMVFVAVLAFMSIILMALSTVLNDRWGEYTDTISTCWRVVLVGGVGGTLMLVLGSVLCRSGHNAKG